MSFSPEQAAFKAPDNSSHESLPELHEVSNPIQISLALLAYEHSNPGTIMDVTHAETVSRQIRNSAMEYWIKTGNAGNFRKYVSDPVHAHDAVDLHDVFTLEKLLQSIANESTSSSMEDQTIH